MQLPYSLCLAAVLLLCIVEKTIAQLPDDASLEMEQWVEQQEQEPELDEVSQQYQYYARHPMPPAALKSSLLQELGFHPLQVRSYERYVQAFGHPTERYEWQAIPNWDIHAIKRVLPLLDFNAKSDNVFSGKQIVAEGSYTLLFRTSSLVQKPRGFISDSTGKTTYAGSRLKMFSRLTYQLHDQLWAGVSIEKDAGEKQLTDFTGFHVFWKRGGFIKTVALGDYSINAGQGLVVWQSLAFGKASDGAGIFRQSPILKPYRSAGEINFFRGIAVQMEKGKWTSVVWLSSRSKTGSMQYEGDDAVSFSSLSTSGYHRTATEQKNKNQVGETVYGSVLRWQHSNFRMTWNGLVHRFSVPWLPRDEPYNRYAFKGIKSFHQSIDYNWSVKQFFVFGELARGHHGWAQVHGVLASLFAKIDASILYRNIQPSYHAYFASAFTEQSNAKNEEGIYANLQARLTKSWKMHAYIDYFRFPWLRFRADAPSRGTEARFMLQWEKRKTWLVYGYWRAQLKPENIPQMATHALEPVQHQAMRLHMDRYWGRQLTVSARLDMVVTKKATTSENGWGCYVDGRYQFTNPGWIVTGRMHWFATGGYNSRLYAYERDLLYNYSVPALFNRGLRYYLQWQGRWPVKKTRQVTVKWWLRWSNTMYTNVDLIGSGWDQITGRNRGEWKFQLIVER